MTILYLPEDEKSFHTLAGRGMDSVEALTNIEVNFIKKIK